METRRLKPPRREHPTDPDAVQQGFLARYQKRFGTLPNLTSWVSYEAVRVIAEAVRAAGSAEPGAVRDAIAGRRFTTLFGDTNAFDDYNLAHLDVLLLDVVNKRIIVLGKSPT